MNVFVWRKLMSIYNSLNAEVLGISIDSFFVQKAFKEANNLNFMLLSDFNKEVSEKYDVLYDEFFGMNKVAKRSAFLIDEEGVIQYAEVLEDASNQPDFDQIQTTLADLGW